ncbi:MAG: hypothetical protein ACTHQQ_15275, partial [Solirubrobacteraceae bacterium]
PQSRPGRFGVGGGRNPRARGGGPFASPGAPADLHARGSLGNPWLFEQLLSHTDRPPSRQEILDELDWVIDRAVDHLGRARATRYVRKFYPWYVERLLAQEPASDARRNARALLAALQTAPTIEAARALVRERSRPDNRLVALSSAA